MTFDWAHAWQVVAVVVASIVGGAVNAVAGGGSLITFPTLVFVGINPVIANASNTVGLWPASVAGAYGYRREIAEAPSVMLLLLIPSAAGGVAGALLLLHTPSDLFEKIAPYLVLVATVLLAAQDAITRRIGRDPETARSTAWWTTAIAVQLVVSVYGGFFGAGIGILMLATLGLIGLTDIHRMNGLKNLCATAINGAALVYFVASGAVLWSVVGAMVAGSIAGGLVGSLLARRVPRRTMRRIVVVIGIVMTAALALKAYL